MNQPRIAYVLDPRFPGGTSSAVASELRAVAGLGTITVHALSTAMFRGTDIAPPLHEALKELRLPLIWDAAEIAADVVVFHNPSCLKFQTALPCRIIARDLVVVTHENFLRPGGHESFDVGKCLDQIARASLTLRRVLAPVSPWNRQTVVDWIGSAGRGGWGITDVDWFNICDFDLQDPVTTPRDRRGRHSRAGFEKFPQREVMDLCFPDTAEANVILGADHFIHDAETPGHWTLFPFRGLSLPRYFEMIDFMVYFTAPTLRESFGRVIAEGIAAGKVVITDPNTAATFDGGAIAADPDQIEAIVQTYIANPDRYQSDVRSAQTQLARFSPRVFADQFQGLLADVKGMAA